MHAQSSFAGIFQNLTLIKDFIIGFALLWEFFFKVEADGLRVGKIVWGFGFLFFLNNFLKILLYLISNLIWLIHRILLHEFEPVDVILLFFKFF